MNIVKLDQHFRWFLILLALVAGGLDYWHEGANPWFRSAFVVSIAGLVGYFTNFLAIKMLFQPKRGSVLGWRGLVPKNQAQIARSLGESVQKRLLSPDVVLAYIQDRGLIDLTTHSLADWVDRKLQEPEVRSRVTAKLIEWTSLRAPGFVNRSFDVIEEILKGAASDPELIARYWTQWRAVLSEFLASQQNRSQVASVLSHLIQSQIPQIANWMDRALEDYLRRREVVGTVGLGLKSLVSLDRGAFEQFLKRFAEDPRVAEEFTLGLDAAIDGLQEKLEADDTQRAIEEHLDRWVAQLSELTRQHMLQPTIDHLRDYLDEPQNWSRIEDGLVDSIHWLKDWAVDLLTSEAGRSALQALLERAVNRLNVTELVEEQVMQLDTDELEEMVLDNTGGNLTVIQVLGGAIGLIAGLVQVHLLFAVPIGALVLLVYFSWRINERRSARSGAVKPGP